MNDPRNHQGGIFGMPMMSVIFDSALTIAIIMAAINMGRLAERIEEIGRKQVVIQMEVDRNAMLDSGQQASLAANDAHYQDIIRRLDSIEDKIEKVRK